MLACSDPLSKHQFVIGDDLQACKDALVSKRVDSLHIIERISVDFLVHNSIIPKIAILPRFKVEGRLPSLHINFSDTKYKSMMRLIDVAIPKFDDQQATTHMPTRPPLSFGPRIFSQEGQEYHIEDHEINDQITKGESKDEVFFEANEGIADVCR
jgi:vacuolar protein sorting-associated protein 13A/C